MAGVTPVSLFHSVATMDHHLDIINLLDSVTDDETCVPSDEDVRSECSESSDDSRETIVQESDDDILMWEEEENIFTHEAMIDGLEDIKIPSEFYQDAQDVVICDFDFNNFLNDLERI